MVQIFDEPPGKGTLFAQGISKGLRGESQGLVAQFGQMMQQRQAKQELEQKQQQQQGLLGRMLAGEQLSNEEKAQLPMEAQLKVAQLAGETAQQNAKAKEATEKKRENLKGLRGALSSVEEMEKIRAKGNLGITARHNQFIYPSVREDIGAYQTLGKSLIPYASSIAVRNQKEFETLAEDLYDPYITDAKARGILTKMKKIIKDSLDEDSDDMQPGIKERSKEKRPLTAFIGAK